MSAARLRAEVGNELPSPTSIHLLSSHPAATGEPSQLSPAMEFGKRRHDLEETDSPDLPAQSTYEDSSTKWYDMLAYRRETDYRNTDPADLDSTIEIMSQQADWIRNQLETESAMLYGSEQARYWNTGTGGPPGQENLIRQDGTGSQDQELIGNTYESSTYLQTVPDTALGVPDIYLNVLVPTNDGNATANQSNQTEPGDIYGCKIKRARRPMGEDDRVAIKKNRKNGVCLRCKMFKEKVGYIRYR